ncbi:MAG: ABC transporter permease [Haloarculaceae archaeon]
MSPTDVEDAAQADGGTAEIPLAEVSAEEVTFSDRAENWLGEKWETFLVAWEDWRFRAGFLTLLFFLFVGTFGVFFVEKPEMTVNAWVRPFKSWDHILGTNNKGRDIFAALVESTPQMLRMTLGGAIFATALATIIGITSGYKAGLVDEILMTITDIVMMLPGLPLLIVITSIFTPRHPIVVGILVSLQAWAGWARNLRAEVLKLREMSYVEASRVMGVPTWKILRRDVLPQLLPLILIGFMGAARGIIYGAVGLYFLGVLPYTSLNWGVLLQLSFESGAATTPRIFHTILWPLLTIVLFSWSLIMISQGLDRVVNVRIRADESGGATATATASEGESE